MTEPRKTVEVKVRGRVQGVGFRAWTRNQAQAVGVTGWVRNEPDGSVRAMIAGPPLAVDALIERLRQGPPGARVASVEAEEDPSGARFARFEISG